MRNFWEFTKHYFTHWTKLKVIEFALWGAYGFFVGSLGFTFITWQYWVLFLFVVVLNVINRLHSLEEYDH
jgi:hypothetical protein